MLQFLAQNPQEKLALIIASYAIEEFTVGRDFPELWGFVEQGYESPNESVRKMVLYIVSEVLAISHETVKTIKFDFLTFLQKVLNDTSDKVVRYAVISLGNLLVNDSDEEGNHVFINQESYSQIIQAILHCTVRALTNNSVADASRMLDAIGNIIEYQGPDVLPYVN